MMDGGMKRGYTHVYTGDGKGKTTAALGLIVRACGADMKVFLGQFIKRGKYCEIKTLQKFFPMVTVEQYGRGCFVKGKPSRADLRAAKAGISSLTAAMKSGKYDIVIADEINTAQALGVIMEKDVLDLIENKPTRVELVLTGRSASDAMIAAADLVTEMREVKHYFSAGVKARRGIEQ